jgi:hypothetical protein
VKDWKVHKGRAAKAKARDCSRTVSTYVTPSDVRLQVELAVSQLLERRIGHALAVYSSQ